VLYQVCNTAVTPNVCASATVTISVPAAGDLDGDGDPDNTDPHQQMVVYGDRIKYYQYNNGMEK
jgi:hypothetical protein